jgi:hypothetical protein
MYVPMILMIGAPAALRQGIGRLQQPIDRLEQAARSPPALDGPAKSLFNEGSPTPSIQRRPGLPSRHRPGSASRKHWSSANARGLQHHVQRGRPPPAPRRHCDGRGVSATRAYAGAGIATLHGMTIAAADLCHLVGSGVAVAGLTAISA